VGAEVFGAPGPDIDAELMVMCQRIWRELGLNELRLEVNTLGTPEERACFRDQLYRFLSAHKSDLDEDSLRRLERNPLRILDSKNPSVQAVLEGAPVLGDFLGEESKDRFSGFRRLLDAFGVEHSINPRLVRGLDYYSHAVFEWITDKLGAQGTVCAGGRYDGLVEIQGGKPWPGVGFAMGLERLVELMRTQSEPDAVAPHVYLVMSGDGSTRGGLQLAERLRETVPGIRVQSNLGGGSFKSQFKRADRSGAALALIVGEDELRDEKVTIKHLRSETAQENIALGDLEIWFRNYLGVLNCIV
jgi:histidyl-tRNA synthetase